MAWQPFLYVITNATPHRSAKRGKLTLVKKR